MPPELLSQWKTRPGCYAVPSRHVQGPFIYFPLRSRSKRLNIEESEDVGPLEDHLDDQLV